MSRPDDAELAAQLRRRSGATPGSATSPFADARSRRLAVAVATRIGQEHQERPGPWSVLSEPSVALGGRSRLTAFAALAVVLVLAVTLGTQLLPSHQPASSPAATEQTAWYLTTSQLATVVAGTATSNENIGRTIVANVQISDLFAACPQPASSGPASCPYQTIVAGTQPLIPVTGAELPTGCLTPTATTCPTTLPPAGPTALTIESGSVKFVASVQIGIDDPQPSTVEQFLEGSPSEAVVIDGWLSEAASPSCPTQTGPYACGAAAWLTDSDAPATANLLAALRVQNDAADVTAPLPSESVSGLALGPTQGLYLLAADSIPADCFQCGPKVAMLLASIEPIALPSPAPSLAEASDSPTAPSSQAIASLAPTGSWLLTEGELITAVADAKSAGAGVGRIVVADAAFEWRPSCTGVRSSPGCAIVSGSSPPIPLRAQAASVDCANPPCPPAYYPSAPSGNMVALEIMGDGSVTFVGVIADVGPLLVGQFQQLLTGFQAGDDAAVQLYPVAGWINGAALPCPYIPNPTPWDCGAEAWLMPSPTPTLSSSGVGSVPPPSALRLQNGAFEPYQAGVTSAGLEAFGQDGTFLLRPVIPIPASCGAACAGGAAVLVAGLDPQISPDLIASDAPLR